MFLTDPDLIISALIELVDAGKTRISVKNAAETLKNKGFNLGSKPEDTLSALIALTSSDVLDLRAGKNGGIGRPKLKQSPVKENAIVQLIKQAIAEGRAAEEVKNQLSNLSND
jgi:hypothetical protein